MNKIQKLEMELKKIKEEKRIQENIFLSKSIESLKKWHKKVNH